MADDEVTFSRSDAVRIDRAVLKSEKRTQSNVGPPTVPQRRGSSGVAGNPIVPVYLAQNRVCGGMYQAFLAAFKTSTHFDTGTAFFGASSLTQLILDGDENPIEVTAVNFLEFGQTTHALTSQMEYPAPGYWRPFMAVDSGMTDDDGFPKYIILDGIVVRNGCNVTDAG